MGEWAHQVHLSDGDSCRARGVIDPTVDSLGRHPARVPLCWRGSLPVFVGSAQNELPDLGTAVPCCVCPSRCGKTFSGSLPLCT